MEVKTSDGHKKQLEKVYNKIHDAHTDSQLTEEGSNICAKLNINPDDLIVRSLD